jgi:hypothetical protein
MWYIADGPTMAEKAGRKISRLEMSKAFGAVLGSRVGANIEEVASQVAFEMGYSVSPFAFLRLVESWNSGE